MMLRQVAGVVAPVEANVNHAQTGVAPPSIRACASNETALDYVALGDRPF
jgi:hypothetical protein